MDGISGRGQPDPEKARWARLFRPAGQAWASNPRPNICMGQARAEEIMKLMKAWPDGPLENSSSGSDSGLGFRPDGQAGLGPRFLPAFFRPSPSPRNAQVRCMMTPFAPVSALFISLLVFEGLCMYCGAHVDVKIFAWFSSNKPDSPGLCIKKKRI